MSLDNSTLPDFREIELNTLALDIALHLAFGATDTVVQISLASLLFGVLTILISTSTYFLIYQGNITQTNVKILLLSNILLHASTTIFLTALIWSWSSRNHLLSKAHNGLFSSLYDGRDDFAAFERTLGQQSWMMTTALAVNFVIGDAIVWWRVCVIWRHKVVNFIGPLLLTVTIAPNVCGIIGMVESPPDHDVDKPYFLLGVNIYALVSVALSLATNALATSLIAYKSWKHRQLLKDDLARGRVTSRVLKALALLIESGCIYCVLLIFVAVYQAVSTPGLQAGPKYVYEMVSYNFIYGCLVPIVAIYPVTIIFLVALKRSPIDTGGLSQVNQARCRVSEMMTVEGGPSSTSTAVIRRSTFHTPT